MKIDDNMLVEGGIVRCAHCAAELGTVPDHAREKVLMREQPSLAAGQGVRVDPSAFTDRPVILRQAFCPQCLTLLSTEIVPGDEPGYRTWSVTR